MGRAELIFIGVVLGMLILSGLYMFALVMIEIGKGKIKGVNKK